MYGYICDRCGTQVDVLLGVDHRPTGWAVIELEQVAPAGRQPRRRTVHTCAGCTDALRAWLDK